MDNVVKFPGSPLLESRLRILDIDRNVHIITVDTFKQVCTGQIPVSALPDPVIRKILLEWLVNLGVH